MIRINYQYLIKMSLFLGLFVLVACSSTPSKDATLIINSPQIPSVEPAADNKISCETVIIAPTPGVEEKSIFPEIKKDEHVRGLPSAEVTILEYGDFQCPGCASFAPILLELEKEYSRDLRVVFRQLPLFDIHDKALLAAQASEAAADYGKFWEMHDLLFKNYEEWKLLSQEDFTQWLMEGAVSIGLNRNEFEIALSSQTIKDRVENSLEDALSIGLRTTPFLLINGQIYNGPRDINSLDQIISLIILGKRQFSSCPDYSIDPLKQYTAILHTEKGDITIQLFPEKAPLAVNSFVFLVKNHWYDNNPFFRVIPGALVQTGDPSGTGFGGPGYLFQNEIDANLVFDRPGVVAMFNNGDESNGSQFFITIAPQLELNGKYTIFGQVTSGMDVLEKLTPRDPTLQQVISTGDLLLSVSIIEQ